jgi:hypothetical protein
MSVSATGIRDRAANDLGMLRLGQSLQAQDATRITQGYAEVYSRLKKEGLAIWAYSGSVPDELVSDVVALICVNCMETYSISNDRAQRIYAKAGEGGVASMRNIRDIVASDYALPQNEPTDY